MVDRFFIIEGLYPRCNFDILIKKSRFSLSGFFNF